VVFDRAESDFSDLICYLDQRPAYYTVRDDCVLITHELSAGIHQLSLRLRHPGQRLQIRDVIVDGCSLRMMLHLSWLTRPGHADLQPATLLWNPEHTWILPFGNPVSFWQTLVYNKLPNGVFGTDLTEKYYIYYPETMQLPERFPPLIRSYFATDFDFTVLPRDSDLLRLPYSSVNLPRPCEDLTNAALQEVLDNFDWIRDHKDNQQPRGQRIYNDHETKPSNWRKLWLRKYDTDLVDRDRLPRLWQLVDSLGLNQIRGIYIGILPPDSYIAPHIDDDPGWVKIYNDAYYLYLPLNWQAGDYFKFSGAGILKDPVFMNICNSGYVHSVVNTTEQTRVVMSLWVDRPSNPNIKLNYV
jgi:hypothetical protein